MDKENDIYTMESYSATKKKKKKEFLPFATIWVTFEGANVK